MPRLVNTFRGTDPTAEAISRLGVAMFGDQLGTELNREKLLAAQRENTETANLMGRVAGQGAAGLSSDPVAQAMIIGSGYDPKKFAEMGLLQSATTHGAEAPQTQNFQVGSGQAYSSTAGAFDKTLAENARQFDQKPQAVLRDGKPVYVPQSAAFGPDVEAILSDTERKGTLAGQNFENLDALSPAQQNYLGADSGSRAAPFNYIVDGKTYLTHDGVTDVHGQPLPPGGYKGSVEGGAGDVGLTSSVQTDLQSDTIANKKFQALLGMAMPLTEDPSLFGMGGNIRSKAQDVLQSFGGLPAIDSIRQEIQAGLVDSTTQQPLGADAAAALIPELYDPRLSEVETLWGLLLYQGAAALAGQENRSVSDKDIQFMRSILGDPHSLFASNISMATKLKQADAVVRSFDTITREALGGGAVTPAPDLAGDAPQGGAVDWRSYFGGQ